MLREAVLTLLYSVWVALGRGFGANNNKNYKMGSHVEQPYTTSCLVENYRFYAALVCYTAMVN